MTAFTAVIAILGVARTLPPCDVVEVTRRMTHGV
jgi:hypothetical protein